MPIQTRYTHEISYDSKTNLAIAKSAQTNKHVHCFQPSQDKNASKGIHLESMCNATSGNSLSKCNFSCHDTAASEVRGFLSDYNKNRRSS